MIKVTENYPWGHDSRDLNLGSQFRFLYHWVSTTSQKNTTQPNYELTVLCYYSFFLSPRETPENFSIEAQIFRGLLYAVLLIYLFVGISGLTIALRGELGLSGIIWNWQLYQTWSQVRCGRNQKTGPRLTIFKFGELNKLVRFMEAKDYLTILKYQAHRVAKLETR